MQNKQKLRKHIKTTRQAMSWCRNRSAHVIFQNWSDVYRKVPGIKKGVLCGVVIEENKILLGNSLVQAVNKWVDWLNLAEIHDIKPVKEDQWIYY